MSWNETDADFGAEDRGRYRHPEIAGDLSYDELRAKVFAALDDDGGIGDGRGFRTLPRIKKHAGLQPSFDLSPVIEGMELDKEIRREGNATITAFFRYEQKVKRFWLPGDGRVAVEFDEDAKPIETKTTAAERQEAKKLSFSGHTSDSEFIDIDPAVLEELAANQTDLLSIANELKIGRSQLVKELGRKPQLQAAFDRGRHTFAAKQQAARPTAKNVSTPRGTAVADNVATGNPENKQQNSEETSMQTNIATNNSGKGNSIAFTAEDVEREATLHGSLKQVAIALGYSPTSSSGLRMKLDRDPGLQEAYDRGVKAFRGNGGKFGGGGTAADGTRRYAQIAFTADDVEREAAKLGSLKRVAFALGYADASGLRLRLKNNPKLQAAFNRGLAEFVGNGGDPMHRRKPSKRIEDDIEVTAHDSSNVEAKSTPLPERVETQEPPEQKEKPAEKETIEPRYEPIGIFEDRNKVEISPISLDPIDRAQPIDQQRSVTFGDGSQLTVSFEGNYFKLSATEREYLDEFAALRDLGPSGFADLASRCKQKPGRVSSVVDRVLDALSRNR